MKSYQFAEHTIHSGHFGQWDQLIAACGEPEKGATVVDLRTFGEIGEAAVPKPPDGWGYRRLPVTGETVSEQDLDVLRREFFRKPQTVVVGPNAARGQLLLAASMARLQKRGWSEQDRPDGGDQGESRLRDWLTTYLVRHGLEDSPTLPSAQPSSRPAAPEPAAKASPTTAVPGSDEVTPPDAVEVPLANLAADEPAVARAAHSPEAPRAKGSRGKGKR